MRTESIPLVLITAAFTAFTAYVWMDTGPMEGLAWLASGGWGWQVMADLGLTLCATAWLIHRDATARGDNPWPWVALCATGAFGPLLYLIRRSTVGGTAPTPAPQ